MTNIFRFFLLACLALTSSVGKAATVSVSVTPATVTLSNSQIEQLTATVTGSSTTGVVWSLSPQVGTLSTTGATAVYTAPSELSQNQTVQVVATSMSDSTKFAKAIISLVPAILITVSPTGVDLNAGQTQQFTPTVSGTTNHAAQWSIAPKVGTVSASGLYTAPASVAVDSTVTVTAMAMANPQKTATSNVRLHAPNGISFTVGSKGLSSVVYNGVNYNYAYGEELLTSTSVQTPGGAVFSGQAPCKSTTSATGITQTCQFGAAPVTVTAAYSTRGQDTICEDLKVTNNSAAETVNVVNLSPMGFAMTQYDPANSKLSPVGRGNPVAYVSFITGKWAIWNDMPSNDVVMSMVCGWSYLCKQQPAISGFAPGQTKTTRFCARFTTNMSLAPIDLVPEAYLEYRTAWPQVTTWPDRRPIMQWFMSDHGHQSATNPRGYFNNPSLNVSNTTAFAATALNNAQAVLQAMKARPVQPQGIILWDIEGQEFIQPTSYIGDPRVLSEGYAPEMNAAADAVFATFKNAGYKVGVTLRPQYMQWGTQLPSQCHYDPANDFKDYFILVNKPFQNAMYACYDPKGINWSLIPAGNGSQTMYHAGQDAAVLALLQSKAQYAHDRWGVTLFYVDSAVWEGGAPISADIFRSLQETFPDSLFLPEEWVMDNLSAGIPYASTQNSQNGLFAPETYRWTYPTGAQAENFTNCAGGPCWTNNLPSFTIGQKIGDIAMYSQPQQASSNQLNQIESMIENARSQASSVIVTDTSTGQQRTFAGRPSTVHTYPLKMRVYFAATASGLANSTLYCESGQWLGENTCSLSLARMTVSQVKYFDFTDTFVTQDSPATLP